MAWDLLQVPMGAALLDLSRPVETDDASTELSVSGGHAGVHPSGPVTRCAAQVSSSLVGRGSVLSSRTHLDPAPALVLQEIHR